MIGLDNADNAEPPASGRTVHHFCRLYVRQDAELVAVEHSTVFKRTAVLSRQQHADINAAEEGLNKIAEQRGLITAVMNNEPYDHPLYEKAKALIESTPVSFQERYTTLTYYGLKMVGDIFEQFAAEFIQDERDSLNGIIDIIHFNQFYKRICEQLGSEELMERLNLLFRQCFMMVTKIMAFIGGFTNEVIYNLTFRDGNPVGICFKSCLTRWNNTKRRSSDDRCLLFIFFLLYYG